MVSSDQMIEKASKMDKFLKFFIENVNISDDFSEFRLILNHSRKKFQKFQKIEIRTLAPSTRSFGPGLKPDAFENDDFGN